MARIYSEAEIVRIAGGNTVLAAHLRRQRDWEREGPEKCWKDTRAQEKREARVREMHDIARRNKEAKARDGKLAAAQRAKLDAQRAAEAAKVKVAAVAPAIAAAERRVTIRGSTVLPEYVESTQGPQALAEMTARAFAESGLSVGEWNDLDAAEREKRIGAQAENSKKGPGRPRKEKANA